MVDDYRNTKYCPILERVSEKKRKLKRRLKEITKEQQICIHIFLTTNLNTKKCLFQLITKSVHTVVFRWELLIGNNLRLITLYLKNLPVFLQNHKRDL